MTLDILQIEGAWANVEGFAQPNWEVIERLIEQTVPQDKLDEAWHLASLQWLEMLRHHLGSGSFSIQQSSNFLLLSAKSKSVVRHLLQVAEQARLRIRNHLGDLAWHWEPAKHPIIIFEDLDSYYRYISHFYPEEGEFSTSGGIFLNRGYCHTALAPQYEHAPTLVHELVHLSVAHLEVPHWLNEGLALTTEEKVAGRRSSALTQEDTQKHKAHWNSQTIQEFWSGSAFMKLGEESGLSYGLACVLVDNMESDYPDTFHAFVHAAKWEDAGQLSALTHLGVGLEEVASTFLGQGDWKPQLCENPM